MGSVRIGCPIIQNADIDPVGSDQPDAVNDDAGRSCRRRNRGRRSPRRCFSVRKHDDYFCICRRRIKELNGFGESICVIRQSSCGQPVYRCLQRRNGSDQLRIGSRSVGKADNPDMASRTDVSVLRAVRCLIDDIDESICAELQIRKRNPRHAAGTIKHQYDIRRVG